VNRPSDDIVNEAYERFNRGDFDGWLEFLDPDVELREEYLAPDTGVYRGHEGVRRWLASGGEAIGDVRFERRRTVAESEDTTVAEMIVSGRGRGSGADFRSRMFHVQRWRDGRIVMVAACGTEDEALRIAGLSR
jgi:ketosteroid isomerase-like protein